MTPESRSFEYALGLFAVLIGLAVVDIATSFHRLIRNKASVKWDPLALLAALYALCTAIYMWFDLWGVRHFDATRHFLFYLVLVAVLFVLFLIAASSLPDEANGSIDLRDYYAGNRRYFWFLVALFQLGYVGFGIYFVGVRFDLLFIQMIAPLAIALVLLAIKSRVVHYIGLGLMFAVMLAHYAPASIN
jgi:hypothetical protein